MEKHTVLVIEDEDEARHVLIQILRFEGFDVLGFSNGRDALNHLLAATQPPCLIVLDILMPIMNGRQVRAALLRDPRLAQIPVIAVTALEPSAASDLAAIRVLQKPIDVDALLEVVRENC